MPRNPSLTRRPLATLAVLVTSALALGAAPVSGQELPAAPPTVEITEAALLEHLVALEGIADANGGDRAFDTPGYDASVEYVSSRLEAAGYVVHDAPFTVADKGVQVSDPVVERTAPDARTYVEGIDYDQPSPGAPTDAAGDLVVVDDGCTPDGFDAAPEGAVVLVDLNSLCGPFAPMLFASMAGAVAVVLVAEDGPGAPPEHIDVGNVPFTDDIAVISVSGDVGAELEALLETDTVSISIQTGWTSGSVTSRNVIAEWPGATDEVIMLGAHLDSVHAGPGINDNGSGTAAMVAIAEALAAADHEARRTIRFGFWGAEEIGLVGSEAYLETLDPIEVDRIVAYLNADMIGSVNGIRGVYDPEAALVPGVAAPGSAAITELFAEHFDRLGLPTVPTSTQGNSDDKSFADAGIPTGGVFTGAFEPKTPEQAALFGGTVGAPLDPCYHLPCDRLDNVDLTLAAEMADALGSVALTLAGEVPAGPPPAYVDPPVQSVPSAAVLVPAFTG